MSELPEWMCPKCFGDYRGRVGCVCHMQTERHILEWVIIPVLILFLVVLLGGALWAAVTDDTMCDVFPGMQECAFR